jgi:hypothetical protein
MKKIRTARDLIDALDRELGWRRKELINIKLLHDQARDHHAIMLRRAGIALAYAHWEGFVKNAGTHYVEFVARQNLRYRDLQPNFLALGMKTHVFQAVETIRGELLVQVAQFLTDRLDEPARLSEKGAVQTKSNLSPARLRDIVAILGLDYRPFELQEKPVLERLLQQRHSIAHGLYLEVDADEFTTLHQQTMAMMDEFRTQIENAALTHSYRR